VGEQLPLRIAEDSQLLIHDGCCSNASIASVCHRFLATSLVAVKHACPDDNIRTPPIPLNELGRILSFFFVGAASHIRHRIIHCLLRPVSNALGGEDSS